MKIILGSSSKPRQEVLQEAGYVFDVISPDIDEKLIRTENFYDLPLLLAKAKAEALLEKVKEPALIVTGDQVVVCNNYLHEKPETKEEAETFFDRYANYPAETVSALVVTNTQTGKQVSGIDIARVFFNSIPKNIQEEYIATGIPFKHAGGFSPEHEAISSYIKEIQGALDSLKAMPLKLLEELMKKVK